MKFICAFLILVFIQFEGFGQSIDVNPCGTQGFKSAWLKKYQANPNAFNFKRNEIINVPITIHRVGRNNGNAKIKETTLLNTMCALQNDFENSDIRFYLKNIINDIDDDDFYEHETVIDGAYKMFENNVSGTINCYFVTDAAGNCGYNLPYAGVAVQESCAKPTDHTWAHEMGHALSLPHPFLGWEGGVSHDNSVAHNYNDPAPEKILYNYTNFKDSLILDTIIIDTALVEKIDGSNCNEASDGFCDTKPDYIYQRWGCTQDTISFTQQTDPDGGKFYSDGSLIMSYSFDNCSARFSAEQIMAMRANALDQKADISSTGMSFPEETDASSIDLKVPGEDEVVYYKNLDFEWSEEQEDQYYLFQIGVEPTFSLILFDSIVDHPSMVLKEANITWGTLYWRVRSFTADNFCTDYSSVSTFVPTDVTSVSELEKEAIEIFPTVLTSGQKTIFINSSKYLQQRSYAIYSLSGLILETGNTTGNKIILSNDQLATGMYFLKLNKGNQSSTHKFFVE